ncbi:MerR family transcriptional regulator [Chromatiales bacterium (ex Bugula neritina AB1)]|nr:MerR family transcriptional regulator [Chromatiales bacterium (ex Bugula neritina AB1)]
MAGKTTMLRNAHFLGTKVRNLRKRNKLTMEDLSARCIKVNAEAAPSVSYLSMIERGKRTPSRQMLEVIAQVFQKEVNWFLDDVPEEEAITPDRGNHGGISGMALEPGFLFTNDILQIAIPEMLSQTGTSGRQFAHLLIRAHQERNQNHFPDLERAAEEVGKKEMPLSLDTLQSICKQMGLKVRWFDKLKRAQLNRLGVGSDFLVRSYFEAPDTIHLSKQLKLQPVRHKYDLAVYIAHKVLHNGDGVKSVMLTGRHQIEEIREVENHMSQSSAVDAQDIIHAWRDFECSFFAAALLCPKVPFRRLLEQHAYEVNIGKYVDVSTSIVMRRMTAVSPYPHWHYFDAYPPGKLNAVYRGNGIPLPWGNMRMVQDPCQHWAVFRKIDSDMSYSSAQISLLDVGSESRIYCCESIKVDDLAGNKQVLCAGIDMNPAIAAQGEDPFSLAADLKKACGGRGGSAMIPRSIKRELNSIAKILNIAWLERGIENEARVICPRSGACPRDPKCFP